MRQWNLHAGDPLCLTIAADARLSTPDYCNDHIWELSIPGGEPPALALQTTFGLRAGWLRLFPRFVHDGVALSDPSAFARPPRVERFYPNALVVSFSPFQGIDVCCEFWVPSSQVVAGRFRIENKSVLKDSLRLEWCALLSPLSKGDSMTPMQSGAGHILSGASEDLCPVCVLTGATQPCTSPFPALALDMELFPGNVRQHAWALASFGSFDASIEAARAAAASAWDGELARVEMSNRSQMLDIQTGDPDWDAAFAYTQKVALSLFFPGGKHLPHPSFVHARNPDQGYSMRGDGSDYPYSWSGQGGLRSLYLASLLPGAPELAEGLLRNFLSTQDSHGAIDWHPGLGGQRGRYLAQPLLATLAWRIDHAKPDHIWLAEIYPNLLKFFKAWLAPEHDRDGDGFPEWDHPLQTGYEDNPLVDRWHPESQGVDIHVVESPALASMLYRECVLLQRMAKLTGHKKDVGWLETQEKKLREAVEACWDANANTYRFRDYQTHAWPASRPVKSGQGNGAFATRLNFSTPQRLLIRVHAQDETTRAARVTMTGRGPRGELSETIEPRMFAWVRGEGRATSASVFLSIESVTVEGLDAKDRFRVQTIDFTQETVSLLLPLWAGIPDKKRADLFVERTVLGRYLRPFGIPLCPPGECPEDEQGAQMGAVLMPWNQLIGEALLAHGRRQEAVDLVTRLMNALIPSLKNDHAFHQFYHAETGQPSGERNSLDGLAPLGLFLQVLGIDKLTSREIILSGFNPFPWPITVQYRGVTVLRRPHDTLVTFPTGQSILLEGPGPNRLSFK